MRASPLKPIRYAATIGPTPAGTLDATNQAATRAPAWLTLESRSAEVIRQRSELLTAIALELLNVSNALLAVSRNVLEESWTVRIRAQQKLLRGLERRLALLEWDIAVADRQLKIRELDDRISALHLAVREQGHSTR